MVTLKPCGLKAEAWAEGAGLVGADIVRKEANGYLRPLAEPLQ